MKRLISRPALLLAVLISGFSVNIKAQDLTTAVQLTRSEQYDKAQTMLKELIQKEPGNSKNYFFLGENYFWIMLQIQSPTHLQFMRKMQKKHIRKELTQMQMTR